jgi:NCAIR mutase (PurE)-related protein
MVSGVAEPPLDGLAELDLGRAARRGYPEAVFCQGKSPQQVRAIAAALRESAAATLFTRCSAEQVAVLREVLPDVAVDEVARLVAWPAQPPAPTGGLVVVACAGTSDLPVAREASLTATHLGRRTELVVDVGVAGLHRVLAVVPDLAAADAVVVVAGMDGALPSVVAGLTDRLVIAVPTSVGYGAAFEGLAALLTMLTACAPGVLVVNIDNGFGAGVAAARIVRSAQR